MTHEKPLRAATLASALPSTLRPLSAAPDLAGLAEQACHLATSQPAEIGRHCNSAKHCQHGHGRKRQYQQSHQHGAW